MLKGSVFLALAAGLLASLMLTTPSQAGSTLVTTDATFSVTPTSGSAADIEVTYSAAPTLPITILPTTTVTVTSSSISGDQVTINFTPVSSGEVDFTFLTAAAPPVTLAGQSLTGISTGAKGTLTVGVTSAAQPIPEPASLALLGIGMTGFFAFRRFFKRTSVG